VAKHDEVMILVDKDFHGPSENLTTNSLNVENILLQCGNDLVENDDL
jgi:hypothetical protein